MMPPGVELRLGLWQEALADVGDVDAVICDPPYSERTHKGQRSCWVAGDPGDERVNSSCVGYGHVTREDVTDAVRFLAPKVRRWFVVFGDHVSAEWWRLELDAVGLYAFSPVIWAKTDAAPRLRGDGPSPQHETITIARPRRRLARSEVRFRPGWYMGAGDNKGFREPEHHIIGQKPLWLMTTLISAYSERGDIVVDPFCGSGTTAVACHRLGRKCIASERDPATFEIAKARLEREARQGVLPGMEAA